MVPIDEDKDLAFYTGYDYDTSALNEIGGNPTPPCKEPGSYGFRLKINSYTFLTVQYV